MGLKWFGKLVRKNMVKSPMVFSGVCFGVLGLGLGVFGYARHVAERAPAFNFYDAVAQLPPRNYYFHPDKDKPKVRRPPMAYESEFVPLDRSIQQLTTDSQSQSQ